MYSSLREESNFDRIEETDYGFSSLQPRQYGVRVARRKAIFESLSSDISSNTSTSSESSPRLTRKPFNASCRNFLAFQTKERTVKDKNQNNSKFTSFHTSDLKVGYITLLELLLLGCVLRSFINSFGKEYYHNYRFLL